MESEINVNEMIDRMLGRTNELNPCPVCGGKAKIADNSDWVNGHSRGGRWKYIYCLNCNHRTQRYFWDDRQAMIDEWNGKRA